MRDPGKILKEERRRLNISVADAAEKLKISRKQLEALEQNNFEMFAGPVFVHGFIRNYSKILGIDCQPIIEDADRILSSLVVKKEEVEEKKEAVVQKKRHISAGSKIPFIAFLVMCLAVAVGVMLFNSNLENRLALEFEVPKNVGDELQRYGVLEEDSKVSNEHSDGLNVDSPQKQRGDKLTHGFENQGIIRITFDEESWVEIKNGRGRVIFSELSPSGAFREVQGLTPLSIVIGNSAGVKVVFNGENVDLAPHTRVSVARLLLE